MRLNDPSRSKVNKTVDVCFARWPPVSAQDRQRWAGDQGGGCFYKDGNGKLCLAAPPPVLFRLTQIRVEVLRQGEAQDV
jgi:hypothetical protein